MLRCAYSTILRVWIRIKVRVRVRVRVMVNISVTVTSIACTWLCTHWYRAALYPPFPLKMKITSR